MRIRSFVRRLLLRLGGVGRVCYLILVGSVQTLAFFAVFSAWGMMDFQGFLGIYDGFMLMRLAFLGHCARKGILEDEAGRDLLIPIKVYFYLDLEGCLHVRYYMEGFHRFEDHQEVEI